MNFQLISKMSTYIMFSMLAVLAVISFPILAMAEGSGMPTEDFLLFLIQSIGGIKGASTLGIVYIVVQILLQFLDSEFFGQFFSSLKGYVKLTIVLVLTAVSGVVGLMVTTDVNFLTALTHSANLSLVAVALNQIYKQYFLKKD